MSDMSPENLDDLEQLAGELLSALDGWRQARPAPSGRPSAAEYRAARTLAYRAAQLLRALGVAA